MVFDDSQFLPTNILKLTEFDQKESLGSGRMDRNNIYGEDNENEVSIQCWVPTHITLLKLLNLCPHLRKVCLLTEERHLAIFAEALADKEQHFYIEDLEVRFWISFISLDPNFYVLLKYYTSLNVESAINFFFSATCNMANV